MYELQGMQKNINYQINTNNINYKKRNLAVRNDDDTNTHHARTLLEGWGEKCIVEIEFCGINDHALRSMLLCGIRQSVYPLCEGVLVEGSDAESDVDLNIFARSKKLLLAPMSKW